MMQLYRKAFTAFLVILLSHMGLKAQELSLEAISTYETGVFDEGAAEIVAYDPATTRVFFTNSDNGTIDVLDISDINAPTLINQIDVSPYGDGVNSVAFKNGLLAAAMEAEEVDEPGQIAFFDADGNFLKAFPAGVLPDMVAFSPDGTKVLSANEGEPDDEYEIDPEGSITIVDIAAGLDAATVTQVDFQAFNGKKASLLNRGIRLFGPGATVAQDLEPEFVSVSPDNNTAFVTLQENNALAVVDIAAGTVVDLLPLGTKDHSAGTPQLTEFRYNEIPWWPDLGTPLYEGAETVQLGGFSGLYYDPVNSSEEQWSFYVIPDRGPNEATVSRSAAGTSQNLRPFKLPNYQARIVKLIYRTDTKEIHIDANSIFLTRKDGVTPISGRGNIPGFDEVPVTRLDDEVYTRADYTVDGISYQELPYDPYGGDFEGILRDGDRNFWMCDEYRPAIYHFDDDGVLIERYVPKGTSLLGDTPQPEGFYGKETLPAVYSKRRANRGFEAIALDDEEGILYAFIQSPIETPDAATVRNNSDVIRILGIDPATGEPVREYVYLLERNRDSGVGLSRVDKIGDAVYKGNGKFLVLERDSSTPDDGPTGKKYVFEIDLKGATNILGTELSMKMTSEGPEDKTLEMMTADDLYAAGIYPVFKTKVLNLPSVGYLPSDKPEGLSLLPDGSIAVMNDNDFGLAGAGVSDISSLGVISFAGNYGFDASNRSETVDISPRPTLGMFMPDAIATYAVGGKTYIVSANEGDARDYDGYSEEERVGDLILDEDEFPDAETLQLEENLGRLLTTTANGDIDMDGDFDRIFSYGARSFSIWDENGNLIYDSADDFEQITLEAIPDFFNSSGEDGFKNRSDDKGPEPEAITVATIDGMTYALIGLERIGGFMVYDISDPYAPEFVQYLNNRNFELEAGLPGAGDIAPEDIVVVDAADSPTGQPLVITANEVSGTVSFFGPAAASERKARPEVELQAGLVAYPNPFTHHMNLSYELNTDSQVDIRLVNVEGKLMANLFSGQQMAGQHEVTLDADALKLARGTYFLLVRTQGEMKALPVVKQ